MGWLLAVRTDRTHRQRRLAVSTHRLFFAFREIEIRYLTKHLERYRSTCLVRLPLSRRETPELADGAFPHPSAGRNTIMYTGIYYQFEARFGFSPPTFLAYLKLSMV